MSFGKRIGKSRPARRAFTWFVLLIVHFMRLVSLPGSRAAGRLAGRLAFYLMRNRRRIALANVEAAYGNSLSTREKLSIARGSFENFGLVVAETAHLPILSHAALEEMIELRGTENVDPSRGMLLVSAHCANWEFMAPAVAVRGYRIAEVVNAPRDSMLEDALNRVRQSSGVETIPKDSAATAINRLLGENVFVGILADQNVMVNSVPVTMFGRRCWATAGPAILARRRNVPVHIALMHRKLDGNYVVDVSEPIRINWTSSFRRDLQKFTQIIQDRIEAHVLNYPEQWHWMHNRWKARPEAERAWFRNRAAAQLDAANGAANGAATTRAQKSSEIV